MRKDYFLILIFVLSAVFVSAANININWIYPTSNTGVSEGNLFNCCICLIRHIIHLLIQYFLFKNIVAV